MAVNWIFPLVRSQCSVYVLWNLLWPITNHWDGECLTSAWEMAMAAELTDPALEMGELIAWLTEVPGSNQPTWAAISAALEVDAGSATFSELIAVVRRRLELLDRFARGLQDDYLDEAMRTSVLGSIINFANTFHPSIFNGQWADVQSKHVRTEDAVHIRYFGQIARLYLPLRRVSGQEREELLISIEAAIAQVYDDQDLSNWAKQALGDGLARLRLIVRHFRFFGHEAALEELMLLRERTVSVRSADEPGAHKNITSTLITLIVVAYSLLVAPSEVGEAASNYHRWWIGRIVPMIEHHKEPPAITDGRASR